MIVILLASACFALATISAVILGYRIGAEKWRCDAEAWRSTALSYRASVIALQELFEADDELQCEEPAELLPANELMAG